MKYKNLYSIILCILVGGFMGKFMLDQYSNNEKEVEASLAKDTVYFLEQGVYSNKEEMEDNINNVSYYIYTVENNKYYAYLGMTTKESNKEKLVNYFNSIGHTTSIKEYEISSREFLEVLQQYDLMLENTVDTNTISAICSQVLAKYEELVISDED